MLYSDVNCVKLNNTNINFQYVFFNLIISVIYGTKSMKFGTPVAEGHLEGIMSQISYSCPSFYLMKCRKLSFQKKF